MQSKVQVPALDENTKRFLTNQLIWIGIYFGIAVTVTIFVDFPYSLMIILAIIIPLGFYRRRRYFRRIGMRGEGSFFGTGGRLFGSRGVDYYCVNCGTKHNQTQCPNCGSKLKKAIFGE